MAELSKLQQVVAYQALYRALAPVVKANGDGLRGEVDRELREIYEKTGAKTYRVQADGVALGTYTVTESKAEPEREELVFDLVDSAAFGEWLAGDGADMAASFAAAHGEEFCRWCADQGVVAGGVEPREVVVPAKPAGYKGAQIRVDKDFAKEVQKRMAEGLAALVAPANALIGDGS